VTPHPADQDIIHAFESPIKEDSHLVILKGNLAPAGAVAKISGKEGLRFTGIARVFHSEEEALQAVLDGTVVKGDEISIDAETSEISVNLSDANIQVRFSDWQASTPRYTRGLLAKYARTVSSASEGAVTDKFSYAPPETNWGLLRFPASPGAPTFSNLNALAVLAFIE